MRAGGIRRSLSLIVLFGLGASGCSESTRQTEPSIVIDTLPGGAVRVTSQGDGDWSLDDAGWSLDPELRIGSLEGEHDAFARVEAVELLSDGRIVVLDRGAHTVTVFDSSGGHLSSFGGDGDTVRIIRREGVERHPVTAEERAAAVEDLSPLIEQGADPDLSRIPGTKPYFSRFLFADDGHLWVQMETEAGFSGQRWDVFDPTGVHLGSVETELDLGTMVIRDGHVLGVVTDELDVQYVVRARIVPGRP